MSAGWAVPAPAVAWRTCALCGAKSDDLREVGSTTIWPTRDGRWESGPRCVDRDGCRSRVETKGGPWPVADGTPATTATPSRATDAAPPDEPVLLPASGEGPDVTAAASPSPGSPPDPDDEWSFDR